MTHTYIYLFVIYDENYIQDLRTTRNFAMHANAVSSAGRLNFGLMGQKGAPNGSVSA